MKILVTGGLGFIGNRAAHYFTDKGHKVHIVDEVDRPTELDNIVIADIADPDTYYFLDHDYDVIIHCAAQTAVTHSLLDPINDMKDNVEGTLRMCELARICDAHLIYTSTNKVYGTNPNNFIKTNQPDNYRYWGTATHEERSIDHTGHTPYGVSKLAADLGTEDQGWVYHIAKQMVNNRPVKIFGDGRQVRDILHVDDLVELMDIVIDKNITGVYNVGGGINNSVSILEMMSIVQRNYGKISFHPWRDQDQLYYVSNINKIMRVANWRPKITKEEGLARLIKKLNNL